jgi:Sulfatase
MSHNNDDKGKKVGLGRRGVLSGTTAIASATLPVRAHPAEVGTSAKIPGNGQVSLPYAEHKFSGNVGTSYKDSDPAQFPLPLKAPAGAPNVLLVLLDDVGYGQFSVAGGAVPSPKMEELARDGVFYTRFHTTALCSPTRAALLTGRNHHVAGTGIITELATGYDGYTGIIPKDTATGRGNSPAERLHRGLVRQES